MFPLCSFYILPNHRPQRLVTDYRLTLSIIQRNNVEAGVGDGVGGGGDGYHAVTGLIV